ncbi:MULTISPECIES: hypothetical protein [unclassified Corynebacterium]|uniref:hypothetical protein n=1 Tax=unclassified Corynebacterium TaxID=2624378 RepID=UPI001EF56111|nr:MULTISPECIES: hypothetical protein [unclassified Corynebacterium]MCG7243575.1 hypothetical protein [Corynebacterium sp. ACRPS]MCG7271739.1 hypothetical protein [Corynebacterium sp. ACRQM]MCG7233792.1 hypothetical protein [Corynebacterium sp. ACRPR]MDK8474850.1 hypothetical protein [Corynebacterium sp. MSK078]MDK8660121.1 hypothetical protein [Corynebacterium sp. MSK204]
MATPTQTAFTFTSGAWSRWPDRFPRDSFLRCCSSSPPGDLFPRISLAAGQLRLDIRPAPPARPVTRLSYAHAPDPCSQPLVKGPDFPARARYRAEYQVDGTDDTIIVDSTGAMMETTTGALVAWEERLLSSPPGRRCPASRCTRSPGAPRP